MLKLIPQTAKIDSAPNYVSSSTVKLFGSVLCVVSLLALCSCSQIDRLYSRGTSGQSKESLPSAPAAIKQQLNQSTTAPQDTSRLAGRSRGKPDQQPVLTTICGVWKTFPTSLADLAPTREHSAKIVDFQFYTAETGKFLISADAAGRILLRATNNLSAARLLKSLTVSTDLLVIAPNRMLAATAEGKNVRIHSLLGQEIRQLSRLESLVTSLDFSPADDALLIGAADGRVYRWDYCVNRRSSLFSRGPARDLDRYIGHGSVVSVVRYHPFGRFFFSGDWQGSFRAWLNYGADISDFHKESGLAGHRFFTDRGTTLKIGRSDRERVANIVTTPDGRYVALALHSGQLELWQVRGMRKVSQIQGHRGVVLNLAISPKGNTLASSGRDGTVRTWRVSRIQRALSSLTEFEIVPIATARLAQVESLVFLDEDRVVVGDASGQVRLLSFGESF